MEMEEVETEGYAYTNDIGMVLFIVLMLIMMIINIPVLILYFRSKYIRTITDKFIFNLILSDFSSIFLLFPSHLFQNQKSQQLPSPDTLAEGILYWNWSCAMSNGVIAGLAAASVLATLEIAMERYLAVVKPLHYHKFLTTTSIVTISIIGVIISFATAMISMAEPNFSVFPHCLQIQQKERQFFGSANSHRVFVAWQDVQSSSNETTSSQRGILINSTSGTYTLQNRPSPRYGDLIWSIYSLVNTILLFIIPVILMFYIYTRIWLAARRQKFKIANQYKPYFLPVPKSQEGPESVQTKVKGTFFHPIVVKFRLMNRFRLTRLDRAGRVAVVALFVTILSWSPYYFFRAKSAIQIIMASYGYESHSVETESFWNYIPLIFAGLHPLLSPLFYAYRYKRLRTEILKQLREFCCNPHDNFNANKFDWKRGGSTANTTSSISGGGATPCIRQVIITHQLPIMQHQSQVLLDCAQASVAAVTSNSPINNKQFEDIVPHARSDIGVKVECEEHPVENSPTSYKPSSYPHISINVYPDIEGKLNAALETDPEDDGTDRVQSSSFSGGVVRVERSFGNLFNYLNVWANTYSRRWLQHRESVTSTASFITLLSNKYHNKTQSVDNV